MGTSLARRGLLAAVAAAALSLVGGNVAALAAVPPSNDAFVPAPTTSAMVSTGDAVASLRWSLDTADATRVASVEILLAPTAHVAGPVHVIVNGDGHPWPCTVESATSVSCTVGDAATAYAFTGPLHLDVVV